MKKLVEAALLTAVTYAVMEIWMALRPPDLSDQIQEWFETAQGRFEIYYQERIRGEND